MKITDYLQVIDVDTSVYFDNRMPSLESTLFPIWKRKSGHSRKNDRGGQEQQQIPPKLFSLNKIFLSSLPQARQWLNP
jgi:hypothetical protein